MAKKKAESVDLLEGLKSNVRSPESKVSSPKPDNSQSQIANGQGGSASPRVLEYMPLGERGRWQVEKFELLAAEFGLRE